MLVPINLTGGDYVHKSRPLSAQRTRNFWPQVQPNQQEKSQYILESFYGLKSFATLSASAGRGMFVNQGTHYRVADTTLYTVSSAGVHTSLGTIPGSGRCIFDAIDADIVIVTGGNAYLYNGSTLTQITSANLGQPNSCASLNSQMLYDDGSGQTFRVSDVGDAATINGLNNADAESSPDTLQRVFAFKQTAYMMGSETIELWWNSGQGNPPFDRIQGGIIDIGIDAIYSAAKSPDFLYFFGSDKQVHAITGGAAAVDTVISTPAMAKIFQGFATTDDAIGWCMQLEGQWFYCLTFPEQDATWAFPQGGEGFEWGTGLTGRIRANSYVLANGKHLVDDYASGDIYELDSETYTDNGETIVRTRDTAPLHGGLFQIPGKRIEMNSFEVLMETGVGNTGAPDPVVMLSWSDDGGKTFGTERRGSIGREGQYQKITWSELGSFWERVMRIRISDPVYCAIYGAAADVEGCI
jgi:hypothetical protein